MEEHTDHRTPMKSAPAADYRFNSSGACDEPPHSFFSTQPRNNYVGRLFRRPSTQSLSALTLRRTCDYVICDLCVEIHMWMWGV